MFHAIGIQARQSGEALRKLAVDTLDKSRHKVIAGSTLEEWIRMSEGLSVNAYCARMRNKQQWGGAIELLALSIALDKTIAVYEMKGQSQAKKIACFGEGKSTIYLLYINRNHYCALV